MAVVLPTLFPLASAEPSPVVKRLVQVWQESIEATCVNRTMAFPFLAAKPIDKAIKIQYNVLKRMMPMTSL